MKKVKMFRLALSAASILMIFSGVPAYIWVAKSAPAWVWFSLFSFVAGRWIAQSIIEEVKENVSRAKNNAAGK